MNPSSLCSQFSIRRFDPFPFVVEYYFEVDGPFFGVGILGNRYERNSDSDSDLEARDRPYLLISFSPSQPFFLQIFSRQIEALHLQLSVDILAKT